MKAIRLAVVAGAISGAAAAQAATPDCARMARLTLADMPKLEMTGAIRVPAAAAGTVRPDPAAPPLAAALPSYCKVSGVINRRTGADGKPYGLRFEIALPDDWQGRFLFQGGGGLNGTIRPPIGNQAVGMMPALARGFAVVSTDSGHQGTGFDASFMRDQQAALDFAQMSLPTVTAAAKRIVEAYYGRPIAHAYMVGCSTGGREAMSAAARFPSLFDGIVAGAPAMRTGNSNLGTAWATVQFNQAAPRDAEGKPLVGQALSKSDRIVLIEGLLAQCDALDGLKDGVIANTTACHFAPAKLACAGAKREGCLSGAQVKALELAFTAPKDASGRPAYAPFPYDTGITAEQGLPGLVLSGPSPVNGPNRDFTIDVDAILARIRADGTQGMVDTVAWTNLSSFLGHGGKMIFYHGMSDPWFSALDTADYYARAARDNGEAWTRQSRFYVVPGMGHCQGGANTYDSFDLLGAMVAWVERDQAPAAVTATRKRPSPATMPLCPFPAYPHYRGTGDATAAESFECRAPAE